MKFPINERSESYVVLITEKWEIDVRANVETSSVLKETIESLIHTWRATGDMALLPSECLIQGQLAFQNYIRLRPNAVGYVGIIQNMIGELYRRLPEIVGDGKLNARLSSALADILTDYDLKTREKLSEFQPDQMWQDAIQNEPYRRAIWGSQRVAFVSIYNAYEAFLIDSFKAAFKPSSGSLRTEGPQSQFSEYLSRLGVEKTCWTDTAIDNAKAIRHSLVHAGGKMTILLDKLITKSGRKIEFDDGLLVIKPDHLKSLTLVLQKAVQEFVVAAQKFPEFT
jgi:hypothetical protein